MVLATKAHAKINLSLRVLGRRPDGYHDLHSLVAFLAVADTLALSPAPQWGLVVDGPTATDAGLTADNLVLKAARALAERMPHLSAGHFHLTKRLPAGAGLGGGSADAAAALRLLATREGLALDDARVLAAARATGADVPVCLACQPRLMEGTGDQLGPPLPLPARVVVLVNPRVVAETRSVFSALGLVPGQRIADRPAFTTPAIHLDHGVNDLTDAAIRAYPVIADVLRVLAEHAAGAPVRMTGSGSTCFALLPDCASANAAAAAVRSARTDWWVKVSALLPTEINSPA